MMKSSLNSGFCWESLNVYKLPEHIRVKFRQPLGELYRSDRISTLINKIKNYLDRGYYIASIGDRVTKTLIEEGIIPKLAVIDKKERRYTKLMSPAEFFDKILIIRNDPGTINFRNCESIANAIKSKYKTLIYVLGEEDLLATLVILINISNGILVYGQPLQGIVLCEVTEKLANNLVDILGIGGSGN